MTLDDHLAAVYAARMGLAPDPGGGASPSPEESPTLDWDAAVAAIAGCGETVADLTARRDLLAGVELRCIVSRVHRQALDAALAGMISPPDKAVGRATCAPSVLGSGGAPDRNPAAESNP